jgi:IclR family KDG regulon transcriptional repressor
MVKSRVIQSLRKGLLMIELLAENSGGLSLSQIAGDLGLNKSTAHHLAATLVAQGFAEQDPSSRYYTLGSKFHDLAYTASAGRNLVGEAEPVLRALAERTGEVAHLMVLDQDQALYLHRVESPYATRGLQMASYVGMRSHLHSSSGGKILLAHMAPERARIILERKGMPRQTARTITGFDSLFKHLEEVKKQGYALDNEENQDGVRCVGAPVFNPGGRVVAAISLSGPAVRITEEAISHRILDLVIRAGKDLSQRLGYRDGRSSRVYT